MNAVKFEERISIQLSEGSTITPDGALQGSAKITMQRTMSLELTPANQAPAPAETEPQPTHPDGLAPVGATIAHAGGTRWAKLWTAAQTVATLLGPLLQNALGTFFS
ncbi:hypothetical protein ACFVFS_14410 [Kitasatospora sp. NPDC057692]|uniref:hypothetical protein n=1 Tax=Kitasatospora sp. NPDC057692 TaxID=3346215 RepID=UPI0036CE7670